MSEIDKAVKLVCKSYKEEFGQDARIKEGEQYCCVFNDGIISLSLENGKKE